MTLPLPTAVKSVRRFFPTLILSLFITVFILYFAWYSIRRYETLHAYTADLSLIDQAIWNTLHGRFLEATWGDQQQPRLAEHFEPILVPLAGLFLLWDDVRILLIFQAMALGIGALPVYWLARSVLGEWGQFTSILALIFPFLYLISPPLQAAAVADFHADPLAVAPFLFAFWYTTQQRWRWLWFWAIIVMLTKENMPTLVGMLGGYLLFVSRGAKPTQAAFRHGLGLILAGSGWFVVATFGIVAPLAREYFETTGPVYLSSRFSTNPGDWLSLLQEPARWRYLAGLLATTGGLALLAPHYLLLGLPLFLANTLSNFPGQYSGEQHYSAPLVAVLLIAAIYGTRNLLLAIRYITANRSNSILIGSSVILISLVISLVYHSYYGWSPFSRRTESYQVTAHTRLLPQLLAQIPATVTISASAAVHPHLAHRPVAYTFPTIVDAEFVLVDVTDVPGKHPNDVKTVVDRLLSSGSWQLLEAVDGFILLQKMPVTESQILPDSFYSFVRTTQPAPQFPLNLTFGNQLQLLGFDVIEKPFHREVSVRLYWQALTDLTDELTIWPQFYDDFGQPLTDPLSQPSVASRWYPPAHWQTDEVIRIQTLPQNLGETFHLGLAVIHGQDFADPHQRLGIEGAEMSYDQATWAQLASFQWTNWELDTLAPAPTLLDFEPTDQIFAKGLRLTGYHLPEQPINSDEPLKLILSWKTSEPLPIDYTIFLHLVDSQNNILAQNDAQPFWLAPYPTRRWPSNQMILDSHMIQPPLPVGSYQLRLGLYDWQTFERLPLETGQDSLSLGEIEVTGVSEKR